MFGASPPGHPKIDVYVEATVSARFLGGQVTSSSQHLASALDVDARLTEIERSLNLLLNVTPVNAAQAWEDFVRGDFGTVPALRLRPLEFEPDAVRRDLTTSRSRTSPTLRCTRCSGRNETRSQGRSQLWRIATLQGSSTGRCSSTEGSLNLLRPPLRSYSRQSPPKRPVPEASPLGRSRRRLVRSSIDTAPCIQISR